MDRADNIADIPLPVPAIRDFLRHCHHGGISRWQRFSGDLHRGYPPRFLIQEQQQALVSKLEQANRQLESYSQQLQELAAGRERQRLARELHNSVTQTIFSMSITTQSALILLEQDRSQVAAQLDRLDQLAEARSPRCKCSSPSSSRRTRVDSFPYYSDTWRNVIGWIT